MPATDTAQLKESIRQSFRKACLMRLEGQEADAVKVLQGELPALVKNWQDSTDMEAGELERLFADELQRTENAHWIVGQVEQRLQNELEALQTLASGQLQVKLNAMKERFDAVASELVTYQGAEALGGRISQELIDRLKNTLVENIGAVATRNDVDSLVSQMGQKVVTVASAQLDVLKNLPTREEMDVKLKALNNLATSEQLDTQQQSLNVLKDLPTNAQMDAKLAAMADKAFGEENLKAVFDNVKISQQDITSRTQAGISSEIAGLEAREARRWADRQSTWNKAMEGIVKKGDLEAALWQTQNSIGERVEGRMRQTEAATDATNKNVEKLSTEIKAQLDEKLDKIISAETFESRLMASANMLHEAQSKALGEAVASLQNTLEKRIGETTAPINQRVSALITYADWERVSRETNEKMVSTIAQNLSASLSGIDGAMQESIAEIVENSKVQQTEMATTIGEQLKAAILRMQDMRTSVDEGLKASQAKSEEGLKSLAERLASLIIEVTEQQKALQTKFQKDITEQQTQSLGIVSAQQQNFLSGLHRDWELLGKHLDELKTRQTGLETDVKAIAAAIEAQRQDQTKIREANAAMVGTIAEQIRGMEEGFRQLRATLPQTLQSIERQIDTKLREQTVATANEMTSLQRKLEGTLAETFVKRLEMVRFVAK